MILNIFFSSGIVQDNEEVVFFAGEKEFNKKLS